MPGDGKSSDKWASAEKFRVVLECASLSEVELAQYCRRKGLYVEQIAAWREACEQANETAVERKRQAREEAKAAGKRIRELEWDQKRDKAALAEAAALLLLRKKIEAVWGKDDDV